MVPYPRSPPFPNRCCGYASAVAGNRWAREGLGRVFDQAPCACEEDHVGNWEETGSRYRIWLHGQGEIHELPEPGERPKRHGFTREEVEAETERGGRLPLSSILRVKVRYFSDGVALSSAAFVEGVFERHRARYGSRRTTGARAMRDLRVEVFG